MLKKESVHLVQLTVRYACFLRVVPYEWDVKEKCLRQSTSKWGNWSWYFVLMFFFLHSLFLLTTAIIVVSKTSVVENIPHIGYCILTFVPSLIEVGVMANRGRVPALVNETFRYFTNLRECYLTRDGTRIANTTAEDILWTACLGGLLAPIMAQCFHILYPHSTFYVCAWFPSESGDGVGWAFYFWFPPTFLVYVLAFGALFFIMPITFTSATAMNFWFGEIGPNVKSVYTKPELRTPFVALRVYRCLQMLIICTNEIFRDFFFIIINLAMTLVVFANFGVLRLHIYLPFLVLYCFFMVSLVGTAYLLGLYMILGDIYGLSMKFINSWKRCFTLKRTDKIFILKTVKSYRTSRLEIGNYGYFQKPHGIRVIGKLVYYTNKTLMTFK